MSKSMVNDEEIIEYVDPHILKPDPNQPRQPDWNSDEVRNELQSLAETFEAQNVINPIEIDENYNIILGERRWRAALLKGLEKIPVRRRVVVTQRERFERQLIDDAQRKQLTPQEKVWAYATGVVNINTKGNYTISDIKRMHNRNNKQILSLIDVTSERDEQGKQKRIGQSLLAHRIGISQPTVSQYLSWFKVGVELQEAFVVGKIPIEYIWRVASLFDNHKLERTMEQIRLEEKILSKEIESSDQLAMIISETRKQIEKRRVEAAREIIPEIVPEIKKPETPEEFAEAAKILREKAKELKTPEQKHQENVEKAKKALDRVSFIEAERLSLNIKSYEKQLLEIESYLEEKPVDALSNIKTLQRELNSEIREIKSFQEEEERKQREAEMKKKIEEEVVQQTREEIKEELRKDEEFKQEIRTEVMKNILRTPQQIEAPKPIIISEEEAEVLRERINKQRQKMTEWMLDPDIQKRGKLFKNWVAHGAMLDVMGSVFCPKDGEESDWRNLRWSCCGLSVEETYEMLGKKLEMGR